jgi:hypothetical protein
VAAEADIRAQVMERDGHACLMCGTRSRPTFQHIRPRGMGGTADPIDARLGIVLHGSGTTGCHGAVEREGRSQQWSYDLGYLLRHGRVLDDLRSTPDASWLVWGHADRTWWELFASGTRLPFPQLPPPAPHVLAAVDAAIASCGRY